MHPSWVKTMKLTPAVGGRKTNMLFQSASDSCNIKAVKGMSSEMLQER